MNAEVLNLDLNASSRKKGESFLGTIYSCAADAVRRLLFVRDASAGILEFIARNVQPACQLFFHAGEADRSHPTEGLLDLMTIRHHKKTVDGTGSHHYRRS